MSSATLSVTAFNPANVGWMNSIMKGYFCLLPMVCTYGYHICIREPSIPMVKPVVMAAFNRCVFVIVGLCSQSKVFWINAWRIIASVKNHHAIRDFANPQFVSESVSANWLFSWHQNNAISITVLGSAPKPTSICLFYACLKNVCWACLGIVLKRPIFAKLNIVWPAKFSCDRVSPANDTRQLFAESNVAHFQPPYKCGNHIICHFHGGV